jgi:hypothetical protein
MENKALVGELNLCAAECDACYKACLLEKDVDMMQRCMTLDMECYDLCMLTGKVVEKGSEFMGRYLDLCADICTACAEECQKHRHDHCQKCAAECRKCAEICREFLHHVA